MTCLLSLLSDYLLSKAQTMPSPTADSLQNLITFVRDLVGDASSESCDCAQEISDRQIIAALDNTCEMIRYERSNPVPTYSTGGQIAYKTHVFEPYLADNVILTDAAWTVIPNEDITYSNALRGEFEITTSRLIVYMVGDRYDPYQAGADLLRSLRVRKRGMVDTSEMGVSIKLSQALAVIESVEASLRRSARVGSITFSRSDVAC